MAIYTPPSISGYNDTPPSDDGSQVDSNEVTWSKHIDKIGDPLNNYAAAISSAVETGFDNVFGSSFEEKSANYTVTTADYGTVFLCTNAITVTTPPAISAQSGFTFAVVNNGGSNITLDGNASETINGNATINVSPGDSYILVTDGSNWAAIGQTPVVATGVTDNLTMIDATGAIVDSGVKTDGSGEILVETGSTLGDTSTGVSINAIYDQDDFASDSNSGLATQQSIKRYVDPSYETVQILGSTSTELPAIPSGATHISIYFDDCGNTTTANQALLIQLGTAAAWDTSGYDCKAFTGTSGGAHAGDVAVTSGFIVAPQSIMDANVLFTGEVVLKTRTTTDFWSYSAAGVLDLTGSAYAFTTAAGSENLSAELTRIRITTTGGAATITGNVYVRYD